MKKRENFSKDPHPVYIRKIIRKSQQAYSSKNFFINILSYPYVFFLRIKGHKFNRYGQFIKIKKNLVYFNIAKCGTSTIKGLIRKSSKIKYISQKEARKEDVFTFVRNPYNRVLSAYLDKVKGQGPNYNGDFLGKMNVLNDKEISFEQFIHLIYNLQDKDLDHHVMPYSFLFKCNKITLFFIGKLENFEKDWNKLAKMKNLPKSKNIQRKRKNKKGYKLEDYYTPELKELVYQKYKEDFERFGYEK